MRRKRVFSSFLSREIYREATSKSHKLPLHAEMNLWPPPSPIPNAASRLFFSSLRGKSADWWEVKAEEDEPLALKSFRIPHSTSQHSFIEGLDCFEGARHWRANLSTFSIVMVDPGLLLSNGSMTKMASPSFNLCIACTEKMFLRITSYNVMVKTSYVRWH